MNITNAQFTVTGSITALVDGVQMSIPADAGNRHYAAMLEQGITPSEYVEPAPTAAQVRVERDSILATAVDPLVSNPFRWSELTAAKQAEWTTYRQDLLDVPQQDGFPNTVTWPTKPTGDAP